MGVSHGVFVALTIVPYTFVFMVDNLLVFVERAAYSILLGALPFLSIYLSFQCVFFFFVCCAAILSILRICVQYFYFSSSREH